VVIPAVFLRPDLITESTEASMSVSTDAAAYGQLLFTDDGTPATVISGVNGSELFALTYYLLR
jgi:hypothetical protein